MAKRTRNKEIILRLTNEEYAYFQNQFVKAEAKSRAAFFLAVLRKKNIVVNTDLTETLVELKQQGNTLNQISKHLNEEMQFSGAMKMTLDECYTAYKKLVDLKLKGSR